MARTHVYTVAVDNGSAPCAPNDGPNSFLTLAICKPQIRRSAEIGDRLIGIAAKEMRETPCGNEYVAGTVIYAAEISGKIGWEEYTQSEYDGRMDCIYELSAVTGEFSRKPTAVVHDEEDLKKDTEDPVLLCRKFRYFDKRGPQLSHCCDSLDQLVEDGSIARARMVFGETSVEDREKKIGRLEKSVPRRVNLVQDKKRTLDNEKYSKWVKVLNGDKRKLIRWKRQRPIYKETVARIRPLYRDLQRRPTYHTPSGMRQSCGRRPGTGTRTRKPCRKLGRVKG